MAFKTKDLADAYSAEKDNHPFRIAMERHSILQLLGSVKGLRILDVACGSGNYSRLFCELGAREVVGVDCSEEMIVAARKSTETNYPITYIHQHAEHYQNTEPFDVIFHSYYLNYAHSRNNLSEMSRALHQQLVSNGKMVGIISMLGQVAAGAITCCNFYTDFDRIPEEGEPYRIYFKEQKEYIINYNWGKETYNASLSEAGFTNLDWHSPLSERTNSLQPQQWDELEANPVFIGVTGEKN